MNDFIPHLTSFFRFFLEKYDKNKYSILLTTTSGIIKGKPLNYHGLSEQPKELKLKTYVNDLTNFIDWYNYHAMLEKRKAFSLPYGDEKQFDIRDTMPFIKLLDVVIIEDATIYSNGMEFKIKSHIVFCSSITGISVVSKDFSPIS